jgi:glycosyltransferase involved in cell wall biosynthesis
MRRLLVLSNGFYPDRKTGTPYWTALVAHGLASEWSVSVLASADWGSIPPAPPTERLFERVRLLAWKEPPETDTDPVAQTFRPDLDASIAAVVRSERPDCVLAMNFAGLSSTMVADLVERAIPIVFFVTDVAPFCLQGYFARTEEPCATSDDGNTCSVCMTERRTPLPAEVIDAFRAWGRTIVRTFSAVAAPTCWLADRLAAETDPAIRTRTVIIPYGLPRQDIPRALTETFTIGFYGGRVPRKGGTLLLRALDRLLEEDPRRSFSVRWYGGRLPDIPISTMLRERIFVRHIVPVEELVADLATIDLSVSVSTGEILPLMILQSLQQGVPVLASDLGGYREYLEHGKNALLVAREPQAVADALRDVMSGAVRLTAPGVALPTLDAALASLRPLLLLPPMGINATELTEARARAAVELTRG